MKMLDKQNFPSNSLFCGDAGFVAITFGRGSRLMDMILWIA